MNTVSTLHRLFNGSQLAKMKKKKKKKKIFLHVPAIKFIGKKQLV